MLLPCARCGVRKHFPAEPQTPYVCDACRDLPAASPPPAPTPDAAPAAEPAIPPPPARPFPAAMLLFGTITALGAFSLLFAPEQWRVTATFSLVLALASLASGALLLRFTLRWYGSDATPLFSLLTTMVYGITAAALCAWAWATAVVEYLPLLLAALLILLALFVARRARAPLLEALGLTAVVTIAWALVTVVLLVPVGIALGGGRIRSFMGL